MPGYALAVSFRATYLFLAGCLALLLVGCAFSRSPVPVATREFEVSRVPLAEPGVGLDAFFVPLLATEPDLSGADRPADLQALGRWLGEARVVGLGESLHGVHDFHRFGHRLFADLARHADFSVYALELDQAHGDLLDQFVQGERDDLDALLAGFYWTTQIFYDEALRDLLLWMRHHNSSAARRVHVAGFDLKQPELAAKAIADGLRKIDGAAAKQVELAYAPALALASLGMVPNVSGFTAEIRVPLPPAEERDTVRVGVWVRGREVRFGKVGLLVEGAVQGGAAVGDKSSEEISPEVLSAGWRQVVVQLDPPPEAVEIWISVYHRGNGTVWFDDLFIQMGDRKLVPDTDLIEAETTPLLFPALQVQDYKSFSDAIENLGSGPALRVECDPATDRALDGLARAEHSLNRALLAHAETVLLAEAARLVQMARLVRQAVEWRLLVEPNRDVFLAKNLEWLAKQGFPDARLLAIAHASHSERSPAKMGGFLAATFGDDYATVSMLALTGHYRGLPNPRNAEIHAPLEILTVEDTAVPRRTSWPNVPPLARALGKLRGGNLLFDLRGAAETMAGRQFLAAIEPSDAKANDHADIAVLVRDVTPIHPIP